MIRQAMFNEDRTKRFWLYRSWGCPNEPCITFIGLNPSTADEREDDPTIRRCIGFAKRHEYGHMYMINLFSTVRPKPTDIDNSNEAIVQNFVRWGVPLKLSDAIVYAWGSFSAAKAIEKTVVPMFPEALCLGKNQDGSPKHPLYLPNKTRLVPFNRELTDDQV